MAQVDDAHRDPGTSLQAQHSHRHLTQRRPVRGALYTVDVTGSVTKVSHALGSELGIFSLGRQKPSPIRLSKYRFSGQNLKLSKCYRSATNIPAMNVQLDNSSGFFLPMLTMKRCLRLLFIATILLGVFRLLYIILQVYGKPKLHPRLLWSKRYLPSEGQQKGSVSVQLINLRVIVLTYNRPEALTRCLASLNEAEYYGDTVHIDVWIDRSKNGDIDDYTYTAALLCQFKFGTITVHNHTRHVGIYGQWLGTWNVKEQTEEIAIFLEDDLTVSKYFYKWLKAVHAKYDSVANINGYSTQGMSMKHSGDPGWLKAPQSEVVFSYPVLGTWGFSPSRKNWIGFLNWYEIAASNASFHPLVPGLKPSEWYNSFIKSGRTDSMWSMWHIYYAHMNNELTIYPNLPLRQGLTTNGNEKGLHFSAKQKTQAGTALDKWNDKYSALPAVPVQLDTHGRVVRS